MRGRFGSDPVATTMVSGRRSRKVLSVALVPRCTSTPCSAHGGFQLDHYFANHFMSRLLFGKSYLTAKRPLPFPTRLHHALSWRRSPPPSSQLVRRRPQRLSASFLLGTPGVRLLSALGQRPGSVCSEHPSPDSPGIDRLHCRKCTCVPDLHARPLPCSEFRDR